jgi:hypothetical protein
MPDGSRSNVWDIPPKQFTKEMKQVIESAFRLGAQAMKQEMQQTLNSERLSGMTTEDAWEPQSSDSVGLTPVQFALRFSEDKPRS